MVERGTNLKLSLWIVVLCATVPGILAANEAGIEDPGANGCSYHGFVSCAEDATCEYLDVEETLWHCVCPENMVGDGLKNGTGCGARLCPRDECHTLATCVDATCVCLDNFTGDGWNVCQDRNECLTEPCDEHATCNNTYGSFVCTCHFTQGYVGDGFTCKHQCTMDYNCDANEACVDDFCVCADGFKEENGCQDIDECANSTNPCGENAICSNTMGGYDCTCMPGYMRDQDDGSTCILMPKNCHEWKLMDMSLESGEYEIDPDGTGPITPVQVDCEMRETFGITVIYPHKTNWRRFVKYSSTYAYTYEQTITVIEAITEYSGFCYQEMNYRGYDGAKLMDGDDWWEDRNGQKHFSWGSAITDGNCECGQVGHCADEGATCNNNGSPERRDDTGKMTKKEYLPITKIGSDPGPSPAKGYVILSEVMCAPYPFDIPKSCHHAKFDPYHKVRTDGPQLVDFDEASGDLPPVLVHCDMESQEDVGITVITHNRLFLTNVTVSGKQMLEYFIEHAALKKLVSISAFCSQDAGYSCKNSRVFKNGQQMTWMTDIDGNDKDYFPGALGEKGKCACAITGTCADDNFSGCNCDVVDGVWKMDYGTVYDMADLPIGSLTFTDIGASKSGSYYVGPLKCSGGQFGIPPTCQDYAYDDYTVSSTLMIDPDGSLGQEPFPVYCEFVAESKLASTIVYPEQYNWEHTVMMTGVYYFSYRRVVALQLKALTTRSVSCFQKVQYNCNKAPLHSATGQAHVVWEGPNGASQSYFAGNGSKSDICECALNHACTGHDKCNCDAGQQGSDDGTLFDKDGLPMMNVNFKQIEGAAKVGVGPLICKEIFPDCAKLLIEHHKSRLPSERKLKNGFFTIDPDGEGGVAAFMVQCISTKTVVTIEMTPTTPATGSPDEGVSKCYELNYKSNGKPVSKEQVQALVHNSRSCAQYLKQDCVNAPLIDHSNFTTCDGVDQAGWASGKDSGKCGCGVTGKCAGGPDTPCNCEVEDGEQRSDGGWILDKERQAICKVCVTLDPLSQLPQGVEPIRRVLPYVSDLFCDVAPIGKAGSCMDFRNQKVETPSTQMVDVGGVPIPVSCGLQVYPPLSWLELLPKNPEIEVPPEGITVTVEYYIYSMEIVIELIEQSGYCTQELWLDCENAHLEITANYGWFSRDGVKQSYWAGNVEATQGCAGGQCNCNGNGIKQDGGIILDKSLLPVSKIKIGPSSGSRTLTVGPVKCFDLPRDCEEIRVKRAMHNVLGNNSYTIDPDGAGGVDYFPVTCDFRTRRRTGITVIPVDPPEDTSVTNRTHPGGYSVPIKYWHANYHQINALAVISGFCLQELSYACYKSPMINFNEPAQTFYQTYMNQQSPSFGVHGSPELSGCACVATGTCPEGKSCHCDDVDSESLGIDYAYETNRVALPVQEWRIGGQTDQAANARFNTKDVKCAPRTFGLPKHCQQAYDRGLHYSAEVLIQPSYRVAPFLVYCEMNRRLKRGVTIIRNNLEDGEDVVFGGKMTIKYNEASTGQVKYLARVSKFCYQPIKIECQKTKLMEVEQSFHWVGGGYSYHRHSVGIGMEQCNCGVDDYCGGSEDRETLKILNRKCNCDAGDDVLRADAGVYNMSLGLPLLELFFGSTGLTGSYGHVTLGKLYCTEMDFDLNECKLGFHDCHEDATCVNTYGSFECRYLNECKLGFHDCHEHATCVNTYGSFECRCNRGYRGYGWENVMANGRNCYDDDECTMNLCPWSSNCTNNPGSFVCTCHDGFTQTGKRSCRDIDECALGIDECDDNARCINLPGSYDCKCNRNFHGDGRTCEPEAICACFGDPHCLSYDGQHVVYQGECQYVMSRDNCGGEPTFELLATFQTRDNAKRQDVTWVKEAYFNVFDTSIALLQNYEVWVDEVGVQLPYQQGDIIIRMIGRFVEVHTSIGVTVRWDGRQTVEIRTPGDYGENMCGLCGNYNGNDTDDLTVGPACPAKEGQLSSNMYLFGNSWVVPGYEDIEPTCVANCTEINETETCNIDKHLAELLCLKVWAFDGKFEECMTSIDPNIRKIYLESCTYDVCHIDADPTEIICESAEKLVEECSNIGIDIEVFRTVGFCEITCEENMEYATNGSASQLTCYDYIMGITPTVEGTQEGCFCKEGFVFDNNKCVEEGDCGCVYENKYMATGTSVTKNQCGEEVICEGNNQLNVSTVTCHPDATCRLKKGRYGCHCKEGFYGDGVNNCDEDQCEKNPCGVNETCLRDKKDPRGYTCICSEGFMGDCGHCIEIDECLTDFDVCNDYNAICVNTIGSYECKCRDGFAIGFNGKCKDLDECAIERNGGEKVCQENSRCSNTIGGFECPCCQDFEENSDTGECIAISSTVEPGPCCVCNFALCDKPGEVCGEDGTSYDSIADMVIKRCEEGYGNINRQVIIDYYGPCQSSCDDVDCPLHQICVKKPNKPPTCECIDCHETPLDVLEPVCTDKLDLYPTYCTYVKTMCKMDLEDVPLPTTQPCEEKNGAGPVGPWSEWSPCSVTCGKGTMTKTRQAYEELSPVRAAAYPLSLDADCYMDPCLEGLCAGFKCGHLAEECVVLEGEPYCECPTCVNIGSEPVCGYVVFSNGKGSPRNWQSACQLQQYACENNVADFDVMHDGKCTEQPRDCARVPKAIYVYGGPGDEYVTPGKVPVFQCEGGCGLMRDDCCRPSETKIRTVRLYNGMESIYKNVTIIRDCECIEEPPLV